MKHSKPGRNGQHANTDLASRVHSRLSKNFAIDPKAATLDSEGVFRMENIDEEGRDLSSKRGDPLQNMSTQDYINKYYEELEQLEQMMAMKRQDTRLRAFGQMEREHDTQSDRIKELEARYEADRQLQIKLSQQRSIYKERGAEMVKTMRDEQFEKD